MEVTSCTFKVRDFHAMFTSPHVKMDISELEKNNREGRKVFYCQGGATERELGTNNVSRLTEAGSSTAGTQSHHTHAGLAQCWLPRSDKIPQYQKKYIVIVQVQGQGKRASQDQIQNP